MEANEPKLALEIQEVENGAGAEVTVASHWPEWVNTIHLIIITSCFLLALSLSIFVGIFPFVFEQSLSARDLSKQPKKATGFRTILVVIHALVNTIVFCAPYLTWYYEKFKLGRRPSTFDESLPMAQRRFYYSDTINDGRGHKIATLGISVSNIIFALIIFIRHEMTLPRILAQIINIPSINPETVNCSAANVCLVLGLFARAFASGVPTFPVKTHTLMHYAFTASMFFLTGIYLILETFLVDPSIHNAVHESFSTYDREGMVIRRIAACVFWFSFFGAVVFGYGEKNLLAFSSICELLAMTSNEIYIMSYLFSFREYDAHQPFFS